MEIKIDQLSHENYLKVVYYLTKERMKKEDKDFYGPIEVGEVSNDLSPVYRNIKLQIDEDLIKDNVKEFKKSFKGLINFLFD